MKSHMPLRTLRCVYYTEYGIAIQLENLMFDVPDSPLQGCDPVWATGLRPLRDDKLPVPVAKHQATVRHNERVTPHC